MGKSFNVIEILSSHSETYRNSADLSSSSRLFLSVAHRPILRRQEQRQVSAPALVFHPNHQTSLSFYRKKHTKMRFDCLSEFSEFFNGKSADKFTILVLKLWFNYQFELKTRLRSSRWMFLPVLRIKLRQIDSLKISQKKFRRTHEFACKLFSCQNLNDESETFSFLSGAFLCSLAFSRLSHTHTRCVQELVKWEREPHDLNSDCNANLNIFKDLNDLCDLFTYLLSL